MTTQEKIAAIVEAFKRDGKKETVLKRKPKEIAVKRKPIKEINTSVNYSGERSPYWDKVNANLGEQDTDYLTENPVANPDAISDEYKLPNRDLSDLGREQIETIEEVFPLLSSREQQALILRGYKGYTLDAVSKHMKISVRSVRILVQRSQTKIKRAWRRKYLQI